MHYKPTKENCVPIDANAVYLIDSGGQYYDGTTDTTRTIHLGTPSQKEVEVYTRLLKSLITLHKLKFPPFTYGISVDALSRQPLWVSYYRKA
jgi:Xaa-Pro aminopeptidase